MTLPTIPGFGDYLRRDLPDLGASISKIINPDKEREELLKTLIAKNPDLLDQYIQKEQDKPGSLAPVFGKNASKFIGSQPLSQGYKDRTVALQQENEARKLNVGELREKVNKRIEHKKILSDLEATDPDLVTRMKKLGAESDELGVNEDQMAARDEALEAKTMRDNARKKAAAFIKGKSFEQVYKDMQTADADTVGAIFSSPDTESLKVYVQNKMQDERLAAQSERDIKAQSAAAERQQRGFDAASARQNASLDAAAERQRKELEFKESKEKEKKKGISNVLQGKVVGDLNKFAIQEKAGVMNENTAPAVATQIQENLNTIAEAQGKIPSKVSLKTDKHWFGRNRVVLEITDPNGNVTHTTSPDPEDQKKVVKSATEKVKVARPFTDWVREPRPEKGKTTLSGLGQEDWDARKRGYDAAVASGDPRVFKEE